MKLRVITGAMVPALLFGACLAANAAEPPAVTAQPETQDVFVEGVKVAIDPKTGHIRPITAAESKQLSDAMLKAPRMQRTLSAHGRVSTRPQTLAESRATRKVHANGGTTIRVPESMMSEVKVNLDANGKPSFSEGNPGDSQQPVSVQQQEAIK